MSQVWDSFYCLRLIIIQTMELQLASVCSLKPSVNFNLCWQRIFEDVNLFSIIHSTVMTDVCIGGK